MTHMPDFNLPEISNTAKPEFTDGASCAAWLAELPLVNVAPSQMRLLDQLHELNRFNMPPAERLTVLEALREPVYFVQAEQIKKLVNKPLPLTQVERGIFGHVVDLWQELLTGFQRCLMSAVEGKLEGRAALICQRGLDCVASIIFDHCRVYHAFPAAYWVALHQLYRHVEEAGESAAAVGDSVKKTDVSCAEVYVCALLFMLADPYEQQQKQLLQIQGWLQRWARHIPVRRTPPEDKSLPPLLLDFSAAAGAYREADAGGRSASHWVDISELARTIKKRVVLLRKGEPPASLGLGEDCAMPGVAQLLVLLFRLWCEGKNARLQTRRSVSAKAKVCSTLASMHFQISGSKMFRQPGHATVLTRREHDEIATFGHTSTRLEEAFIAAGGFATEDWLLQEESLSGLRIVRPATPAGGRADGRYAHTQLIAVRPADARNFLVGAVRWLKHEENDDLHVGVHIVPGVPIAVAVRPTGINAQSEKFVPALYCPALPALSTPASLILPLGWYRPRRVLEVYIDASQLLLLSGVIERGSDFERVAIEPAS
jgi:cyclic-di-GMP-binding protein